MTSAQFTTEELANEIWEPINGFSFYAVSNLGRIKRTTPSKATFVGRILKPTPNKKGYQRVNLYDRPRHRITCYVHILVAKAFIGDCPEGQEVNHKDAAKTNNRSCNLEYRSHIGNMQHAVENRLFQTGDRHYSRRQPERMARGARHGSHTRPESIKRGEKSHAAKLTAASVEIIRKLLRQGFTHATVAAQFNVNRATISYIAAGKTWRG